MTELNENIQEISKTIDKLTLEVNSFITTFETLYSQHIYLSEILLTNILHLDSIESFGDENIRGNRKEQIDRIQKLLILLDQCKFRTF